VELRAHHWLGERLLGATMRHVAVDAAGVWLALVGFGSAVLSCGPRDVFAGWNDEQRRRRLRFVVNNQRFCVLPAGRRRNVASAVLARSLRRLSGDYQARWGHPVLVVETFVDPARHAGTCYRAAGFEMLGATSGWGRRSGRYVRHGNPKLCFARPLRRGATRLLAAPFDHPLLAAQEGTLVLDLNALEITGERGLLARLGEIEDHRKRRGVRHNLASVLAIAAAATLSGARNLTAIGEWAADAPQDVLERLGAKHHQGKGRFVPPHDATIRRAVAAVDADALDRVIGDWLAEQVQAGRVAAGQVAVAVDGKSLRGARSPEDGRPVHLFAAMTHGEGAVIAQREVDHKTNEITELRPLLEDIDIGGAVVTADALHAQRDHAEFLVGDKNADYVLGVKANQPKLLDAIESLPRGSFSP
jgi:hypothetical protein